MEKLEKKLGIYCLFNKETEKYDTFSMSYSDDEAKDYFLDQLSSVAYELASKADTVGYNKLFRNFKDTCFMRLATFDETNGVFINEAVVLIDVIEKSSISSFIKAKFALKNEFSDVMPKDEKK